MTNFISQPSFRAVLNCTKSSPVSLKVLVCMLFVFFNRAQRVLRSGSMLVDSLDVRGVSILPLVASAVLHTTVMCTGLVIPTRGGRVVVIRALIHVLLLHAFAIFLVVVVLNRYITTASFLSVLLASHLCLVVSPIKSDLLQAQRISYGYIMRVAAYAIPIICWILIPVLRVNELEAMVLLYTPEALCFVFAHILQFVSLLLHVAVVSVCSVVGISGIKNDG